MSKKIATIDILKAIACLLITNSHCLGLYPVALLAVGGGQGNTLFLIVTGYLLAEGVETSFATWISKRYLRILPISILVASIWSIVHLIGLGEEAVPASYIRELLDRYWFIWAVSLYYPAYYLLMKGARGSRLCIRCLAFVFVYLLTYVALVNDHSFVAEEEGFGLLKVVNYFGVMLLGGAIRRSESYRLRVASLEKRSACRALVVFSVVALLGLGLWSYEYIQILLFNRGFGMQCLIHVGNALFGAACLSVAIIANKIFPDMNLPQWLRNIADSTLEIYLVQVTVRPFFNGAAFPFGPIVFVLTVMLLGVLLHRAAAILARKWERRSGILSNSNSLR